MVIFGRSFNVGASFGMLRIDDLWDKLLAYSLTFWQIMVIFGRFFNVGASLEMLRIEDFWAK